MMTCLEHRLVTDRRTDTQTQGYSIHVMHNIRAGGVLLAPLMDSLKTYRVSVASRGKSCSSHVSSGEANWTERSVCASLIEDACISSARMKGLIT